MNNTLLFNLLSNVTNADKKFIDLLEEHLQRIKSGISYNDFIKAKNIPCCGKKEFKKAIDNAKNQTK